MYCGVVMNEIVIGARIIDVLTTGMYPDPLDAIREYIQNSFDAIRQAERKGILRPNFGEVKITIDTQKRELSVRDNGIGIPSGEAKAKLMSLGASKKTVGENAGFRGIGRLAGLAYCKKLAFKTAYQGETQYTELEFDGNEIHKAVSESITTDESVSDLLIRTTKHRVIEHAPQLPFFEVKLIGIPLRCPILEIEQLKSYIRQVSPVEFNTHAFVYGHSHINPFLEKYSARRTINLSLAIDGRQPEKIQKPYKSRHPVGNNIVDIHNIETIVDPSNPPRWIAWLSVAKDLSGVISSDEVRGIRFRSNNIMIGNYNTLSEAFGKVGKSYTRFNGYFSGEIHILDPAIVPNARRDDFEDTEAWLEAERTIIEWLKPLVQRVYRNSRERNQSVDKLIGPTDELLEQTDVDIIKGFAADELRQKADQELCKQEEKLKEAMQPKRSPEELELLEKKRQEIAVRRSKLQEGPRSLIDESSLSRDARKVLRLVMDSVVKVCGDDLARKTAEEVNKRIKRGQQRSMNH